MSVPKRVGFTLIELLIVMAIIGILIGLLFPAIKAAIEGARRAQAVSACKQIETAIKAYYNDYGKFPTQTTQADIQFTTSNSALITALLSNPRSIAYLDIGEKFMISGSFVDPWDKPYYVTMDGSGDKIVSMFGNSYTGCAVVVGSMGPDALQGSATNNLDNVTSYAQ